MDASARGTGEVFHHRAGDAQPKIVGNAPIDEMDVAGSLRIEVALDHPGLHAEARQRVTAISIRHAAKPTRLAATTIGRLVGQRDRREQPREPV